MPVLTDAAPIRFDDRSAASLAVIERSTRRVVLYDVVEKAAEGGSVLAGASERVRLSEANAPVYAFAGDADRERAVVVADLDGDGADDLVAADRNGHRIAVHLSGGGGLNVPVFSSSFKQPKMLAIGRWEESGASVFVLSEEENAVGVSRVEGAGRLGFPQPLLLGTGGGTPVAMGVSGGDGVPAVGVVVKDGRDHVLEVHQPIGEPVVVELEDVRRSPSTVLFGDFDRDGGTDTILLTPGEPLILVSDVFGDREASARVYQSDDMPQFGLVQNAGPTNTVISDVDGDGSVELVIADVNFVRAAAFDVERGWRVVEQATAPLVDASFVGLTMLGMNNAGRPVFAASDAMNGELVIVHADRPMAVTDRVEVGGVELGSIVAADVDGRRGSEVLFLLPEGFAAVSGRGELTAREHVAAHPPDDWNRVEHELGIGEDNIDGELDRRIGAARVKLRQDCRVVGAR